MTVENKKDVVYFSVDNWFCGRDYPHDEQFIKWMRDDLNQYFRNEEWVKENKLCVKWGFIDMSMNYCVTAPREWVEQNCPKLLTDDEYEYDLISSDKGRETYKGKYSEFVYQPDEEGNPPAASHVRPLPSYVNTSPALAFSALSALSKVLHSAVLPATTKVSPSCPVVSGKPPPPPASAQ